MKTLLWTLSRGGFLLLLLALVPVIAGCGPSRKQYAINEALLIDQTRILENEVYRTRYQLQKCLDENERLRKELGVSGGRETGDKGASSNRVLSTESESTPVPRPIRHRTQETSGGAPDTTSGNAPRDLLQAITPDPGAALGPRDVTPRDMVPRDIVPRDMSAPRDLLPSREAPVQVPSPRAIVPNSGEKQNLVPSPFPANVPSGNSGGTPPPSASHNEVLPDTIVVPVSRTNSAALAPPLNRAGGATSYGSASVPASSASAARSQGQSPRPKANAARPASSNEQNIPPLILQENAIPSGTGTSNDSGASNGSARNAMPGLTRPIEPANEPTPVTGWIWSNEEKLK